ncbi:MAG TPA: HAMP domain-containing sensor histidine kinase [Puia sp.]|nr:HAMP domain-containing sensor histidine kinase [Puia sp.]
MTEITRVSLENEMDIVVAHKRMISIAQFFSLLVSTQTTIATAVAEVCRVIIDKTDKGWLAIYVKKDNGKFFLGGRVTWPADIQVKETEEGLRYAQLLVPEFHLQQNNGASFITVSIGIPRSLRVTDIKVNEAIEHFKTATPTSPYEKLKLRNTVLNLQALEKEEELRQTRLLDEKKNEFISIASHELKTPLTSILAFTKLALKTGAAGDSTKTQRYLEKIDNQVNKLHRLILQLLDISRIESGKLDYHMEDCGWNGYMEEVVPLLEHLVPTHRLAWQPCRAEVLVRMDGQRIEQVLTNLVGNAAKYSNPDTQINIDCSSDTDKLTVCVRDQGIGISQENLSRIFEKYFRDDAVTGKYSGFGMGLYISSGIIQEHQGTIRAERNDPTGSSFYFTLPLSRSNGA